MTTLLVEKQMFMTLWIVDETVVTNLLAYVPFLAPTCVPFLAVMPPLWAAAPPCSSPAADGAGVSARWTEVLVTLVVLVVVVMMCVRECARACECVCASAEG